MHQLSIQDRRIIAALLRKLAVLEARGSHAQALRLIDQVQSILDAPDGDA